MIDTFAAFRLVPIGTQLRQGDILLVAEAELPPDAEALPLSPGPVYYLSSPDGQSAQTHAVHRLPGLKAFRAKQGGGLIDWLRVTDTPVALTHPQHAPLTLAPGLWRVIRQRAYNPATARSSPCWD